MRNPAMVIPEVMPPIQALTAALEKGGVPPKTLGLVHLRVSQMNGCGLCLDLHLRMLKKAGESEERLMTVAAWRHTPYFDDAERAALALAEAATRLNDRADPVPDEVWREAAKHHDERALATLVMHIGLINFFNRVNVMTAQVAGSIPNWDR
jgi:AhpD family alkylhydroperoxidase